MDKWLKRSSSKESSSFKKQKTLSLDKGKPNRITVSDGEKPSSFSISKQLPQCEKNKKSAKRKYDENYLKFGFIFTGNVTEPLPQCVICLETLSNHSMKPSLLMRHFNTKHEHFQRQISCIFPTEGI